MKELIIPFATAVGYMLKVLKSNVKIDKFNPEFKMIRHGNYFEFINSVKGEIPHSVVYNKGKIISDNIARNNDFDFLGLFNANPSLQKFYIDCYKEYGKITDTDIPDSIYGIAALFEISLRMHANNHNLIEPRENLNEVINKLTKFKNLNKDETNKLHQGRRFINMVKHFNNQFPTWNEGIDSMTIAYEIVKEKKLTII
ncbi:hypothetical protein [Nonlabens ulvanivorans]|uniref:Uncharacterized protein n=1 Tax=Nonlabens ulvanivorans TaxID=906888 RepID=A0A081DBI4_NONUL|nr:hypothetical protein [Nonlabens ulvanivorans]WOI23464.1 hypothetical protein R1T42_03215 [Nonlabens ulvanivorans]GAK76280.1 hypothetical protein JCM19296_1877 [Nonlabens ulvanivorans]